MCDSIGAGSAVGSMVVVLSGSLVGDVFLYCYQVL